MPPVTVWTRWSCVQAFCRDVFLLGCCSCEQLVILWVFGMTAVNIFWLVNKIVLTSSDEYFSAIVLNGWVLHSNSLHPLWSMAIFSTNISQDSVATPLRDGGIFYYCFITNLLLLVCRWKNFVNWSAFGKVGGKNIVALFYGHGLCFGEATRPHLISIGIRPKILRHVPSPYMWCTNTSAARHFGNRILCKDGGRLIRGVLGHFVSTANVS